MLLPLQIHTETLKPKVMVVEDHEGGTLMNEVIDLTKETLQSSVLTTM